MEVSPGITDLMIEMMFDPEDYELEFDRFDDCFDKSETFTSKEMLFNTYCAKIHRIIPRSVFFIALDRAFGMAICDSNSKDGDLGYFLIVK